MKEVKYWQAINTVLRDEMSRDDRVVVIGQDVAMPGGPFSATRGLLKEFGSDRVKDTPISEAAIVGTGLGAAMVGLRPIVELMFMDFTTLAMDQLAAQAPNVSFLSGGRQKVPLTVRMLCASRCHSGPQHSKNLESWLGHIPGWSIVWGSTPSDVAGLLRWAIREDSPVIVIESLELWTDRQTVDGLDGLIKAGSARVARTGDDVTMIAIGGMVKRACKAAENLAKRNVDVEVVDLRSIYPLDMNTIRESISKTHRAIIVHDAILDYGYGGEVAALIAEHMFYDLDAPICRIGAPREPVPFAPALEEKYYPSLDMIEARVIELMEGEIA